MEEKSYNYISLTHKLLFLEGDTPCETASRLTWPTFLDQLSAAAHIVRAEGRHAWNTKMNRVVTSVTSSTNISSGTSGTI